MNPVEEIKERLNIVDIVQEYVKLKNAGANHKGLCPFHNESTPSFTVSEGKQFFHCFGCGKGGDIFTFIQDIESVEFAEALRILAKKAGVKLTTRNPREENERTRLIDCIAEAVDFFQQQLKIAKPDSVAVQYIQKRAISAETVEQFQLGYAPDTWDALLKHLKAKQYTEKEIEQAGLIIRSPKTGGYYDRFRNRLMFPIHNVHGNVAGFTARTLSEDEKEAKYINSPQTPLYNKSAILYGLYFAKKHIQNIDAVVLVEGNMDVVSAHQAKFRNVVASSGTALTEEQVRFLKRYTANVLLAFDADEAGIRAAWKGMQVAIQQGMNIKVLRLPEGKDPDDIIRANPQQFRELAHEAKPFMEYAIATIVQPLDLTQALDKKNASAALLPMLAMIPDAIEQTHYIQQLAKLLSVPEEILKQQLPAAKNSTAAKHTVKSETYTVPVLSKQSREYALYERGLALCILYPEGVSQLFPDIVVEEIPDDLLRSLYNDIQMLYSQSHPFDPATFLPTNPHAQPIWAKVQLQADEYYTSLDQAKREKELFFLLRTLKRYRLQRRLLAVQQNVAAAEQVNDQSAITRLSQELSELTESLRTLL